MTLEAEIPFDDIPKFGDVKRVSLEGEITLSELLLALKRMKIDKSPGSDGFTVEFFQVSWIGIGKFIYRSINFRNNKGEMSVTQRYNNMYSKR